MTNSDTSFVTVRLPAELAAKMDELKLDRDDDRNKSVEELVREYCESYVKIREMARWEIAHIDELDRSYEEQPDEYADTEFWEETYQRWVKENIK
jgi:metal-responsive CopG/Arc/MetJ family transcriptional regulator